MTGMPNHVKVSTRIFHAAQPCFDWAKKEYIERSPEVGER